MKKWLLLTILLFSFCFAQEYKIGTCINNENNPNEALTLNDIYSTSRVLWNTSETFICKNVNTIVLDLNGGAFSQNNLLHNLSTIDYTFSSPTKVGHTFSGWTGTNISSPISILTITKETVGDKKYVANFTPNQYTYTVKYISQSSKTLGSNSLTKYYGEQETINPPSFTGYNTPQSATIYWDSTEPKTINFTYSPVNYTISYNLDGGTASGLKTSYTIEESFSLPTPTKANYDFVGWTGSDINTPQASVTISSGSTGNKSYTANWKKSYDFGTITNSTSNGGLATMYINTPSGKTQVSGYSSGGVTLWNAHPDQFNNILNKTSGRVGVFSGTRSGTQTINSPDTNREVTYYFTGYTDEGSTNIGGFKVKYGNTWYTLRQAINNGYIKPLVPFYFINAGDKDGSNKTQESVSAWFDGGSYKGHRYIHQFGLIVQANKGVQAVQAYMGYWESSLGQYWYSENGLITKS